MSEPNQVVFGPAEFWIAPVGTTFPEIDAAPIAPWSIIGVAGNKDITDEGITVRGAVADARFRGLAGVTIRKMSLVSRDFEVSFKHADLSAEALAAAYGLAETDIEDDETSGGTNIKRVTLPTSPKPFARAAILRCDQAAPGDEFVTQYNIFCANQVGGGEGMFSKSKPFDSMHSWVAVEISTGWVEVIIQDEADS